MRRPAGRLTGYLWLILLACAVLGLTFAAYKHSDHVSQFGDRDGEPDTQLASLSRAGGVIMPKLTNETAKYELMLPAEVVIV